MPEDLKKIPVTQDAYIIGPIIIDSSGLRVFNSGIPTIYLDVDGDAFFGANLDDPAYTSLIIFSNAQDYNGESFGEGDLLVGDNSTSRANMFWDRSAGKLQFRGGTTMAVEIDTDGTLLAGAGAVEMDASGITVANNTEAPRWKDTGGTIGATINLRSTDHLVILTQNDGKDVVLSASADIVTHADSDHQFIQDNSGGIMYFWQKLTDSSTPVIQWKEDATDNRVIFHIGTGSQGGQFNLGGDVILASRGAAGGPSETVFNDNQEDTDFRIEGANIDDVFKVDAGLDQILAGTTVAIKERADQQADIGGYGQLWVKNTTPCELWFTDDVGTDTQLA